MLLVLIGASQSDKKNSIQKNQPLKSHNYISSKESYLQMHLHSHDAANIQLLKCSTRDFFPLFNVPIQCVNGHLSVNVSLTLSVLKVLP